MPFEYLAWQRNIYAGSVEHSHPKQLSAQEDSRHNYDLRNEQHYLYFEHLCNKLWNFPENDFSDHKNYNADRQ